MSHLPNDLPRIYAALLQKTFHRSNTNKKHDSDKIHIPRPRAINQPHSAMLMFEMPNKAAAIALHSHLNQKFMFGHRLTAKYGPKRQLGECSPVPTVADVTVSERIALGDVQQLLAALPGMLGIMPREQEMYEAALVAGRSTSHIKASKFQLEPAAFVGQHFVVTFADEGSALHARAVLSGRRQQGGYLFIKPRPVVLTQ